MPILTQVSESAIADLEWPNYRSQRWGSEHQGFVRPIRWICSLLGSEVVPVTYADVTSSNTTRGHRVLGPGEHVVACPADYEATLEAAGVLLADRRDKAIRAGIEKVQAQRPGCVVDTPKGTYAEVVNLCEWPTVLVGVFDEEFLRVPHEIICESMGAPCVCGVDALSIDAVNKTCAIAGTDVVLHEGDVISIDGTTGDVILGEVALVRPELGGDLQTILGWADEIRLDESRGRVIGVRANADNPDDAQLSANEGAEGIGLDRTEHMRHGDVHRAKLYYLRDRVGKAARIREKR